MFHKLRVAVILATLLAPLHAHALEIASSIATINSASTDGTPSASVFELSVQSSVLPTGLTTTTAFSLTLDLRPQASSLARSSSVYTVIVANNQFFKLEPDGSYAPWDGAVETLTPFVTGQLLSSTQTLTLLNGTMAEAGDYLYYVAYSVEGETTLHFTPEPAQISVKASTELPDNSDSQAAITFGTEIETSVVQARCVACHVEGGLARNSALQFQRSNTASALNNFGALSAYVDEKGSDLLLAKITGEQGHAGGKQLARDSEGYASIEKMLTELSTSTDTTSYVFNSSDDGASARQASFLTEVMLEPRQATLRRAALLLQGRLPTDAETSSAVSDETLRATLRGLMEGPAFREFVVTGVNDRLLTDALDNIPITTGFPNFVKLRNYIFDSGNDFAIINNPLGNPLKRASGELVAHVIEKDRPYSEILTADYMMMNPLLNEFLEGDAIFSEDDTSAVFKPSRIKGFYPTSSLEMIDEDPNGPDKYSIIGPPLDFYPHAGLLNDLAFLDRYPTTATNRNRARARWTFYHFLGIDIEKSSLRPLDEASLTDVNNPTMNNPNCTVCHALLDPVAGAFQNWGEFNSFKGDGEHDTLDSFYKYPTDGSQSLYQTGDLWYRDMRSPGLLGLEITEEYSTLASLAALIIKEDGFLEASAKFWWPAIFGREVVERPSDESDQSYAGKYRVYSAQQAAIKAFGGKLDLNMNAKDMLVEMIMSPWFGASEQLNSAYSNDHAIANLGNKQLLTPEQLARKTRSVTGVAWRTRLHPNGIITWPHDQLGVLLGGIDSDAVTSRAIELTPMISTVLQTYSTETACLATLREFSLPVGDRKLFSFVDEKTTPFISHELEIKVEAKNRYDWKDISLKGSAHGLTQFSLSFINNYCDYDGEKCTEQRQLFIQEFSITSPSGLLERIQTNDPRLSFNPYNCSNVNNRGDAGIHFWNNCTVSLVAELSEHGSYEFGSKVSSIEAPRKGGRVEVAMRIVGVEKTLSSLENENVTRIKNQIVNLYKKMHGKKYSILDAKVEVAYNIYLAALQSYQDNPSSWFSQCNSGNDGLMLADFWTDEELSEARTLNEQGDGWDINWDKIGKFNTFQEDQYGAKRIWTAVMTYMISSFDYLHE
jgi:hypothetical protein